MIRDIATRCATVTVAVAKLVFKGVRSYRS